MCIFYWDNFTESHNWYWDFFLSVLFAMLKLFFHKPLYSHNFISLLLTGVSKGCVISYYTFFFLLTHDTFFFCFCFLHYPESLLLQLTFCFQVVFCNASLSRSLPLLLFYYFVAFFIGRLKLKKKIIETNYWSI